MNAVIKTTQAKLNVVAQNRRDNSSKLSQLELAKKNLDQKDKDSKS